MPENAAGVRIQNEQEDDDMRTVLIVALTALAGCASAPRHDATMDAAANAPAQAASASVEPKAVATGEKRAFNPPTGYKAKIDEWSIVYCKKTPVLGSRFPKEVCMTEAQLREHMATTDAMRRDVDQSTRVCSNPEICAGE